MVGGHTRDLPLHEARALIERAIDKAEQLGLSGGIAVVGGSGALVSASRMDHGGAGGMARAWSKAWISGTQQIPSTEHLTRMNTISPHVAKGFVECSPEARFPGAGGMPITRDGAVVAGIAASGATVSPFIPAGADPQTMIADGKPANPEDMLIHYALGLPYVGQHGDDEARWVARFGDFPSDAGEGLGSAPAPAASEQTEHRWAVSINDAVMKVAAEHHVRVAAVLVDHRGDPIQLDRMDDAPSASVEVAQAVAVAAATFQLPSGEVAAMYSGPGALEQLGAALPFAIMTVPGGVPVEFAGRVVGGLGVGGVAPELADEIAAAALASLR